MSGKRLATILALLVLGALALTGCSGLGQGKRLLLANIGWDENVAVSNLTKALLEDELGYERVDIDTNEDLDATYRDVASGEPHAGHNGYDGNNGYDGYNHGYYDANHRHTYCHHGHGGFANRDDHHHRRYHIGAGYYSAEHEGGADQPIPVHRLPDG